MKRRRSRPRRFFIAPDVLANNRDPKIFLQERVAQNFEISSSLDGTSNSRLSSHSCSSMAIFIIISMVVALENRFSNSSLSRYITSGLRRIPI